MLHSHTQFCDGHYTMEEMAAAACRAGLKRYGFSPHSPLRIPSPCNMKKEEVDAFLAESNRLKSLFIGKMEILSGMEIDFLDENWGPHIEYFQNLPLDYRIGSVHFVPTQRGNFVDCDGKAERFLGYLQTEFEGDLDYVVNTYLDQVEKMIDLGGFDILGHLDKIAANASTADPHIEDSEDYAARIRRIIEKAVAKDLIIEINTKAYAEKNRFFPAQRWWGILKELNAKIAIHSDAHHTDRITAGMPEALKLWKEL